MLLAGGSSLLPEIDKFFANKLNIPVAKGDALRKISDPAKLLPLKNKAILFANVIGLSLRGLAKKPDSSDINLLPIKQRKFAIAPDKRDKKAWLAVYVRVAILILLIGVLVGLISLQKTGYDLYQKFVTSPVFETNVSDQNFDLQIIDDLRQQEQSGSTANTTTTTSQVNQDQVVGNGVEPAPVVVDLQIQQTSLGYLNVRQGAGVSFVKVGQVESGSIYSFIDQKDGWYKIEFEPGVFGWVSGQYIDKL